ncbi:MAG TPA: hypothetical protein DGK91_12145 [Clostridium sp.]|jgi:hypothetical protein|nr:hypothetical protein [Clostridium sp.]
MKYEIKWYPVAVISEELIRKLERHWNVVFPKEYVCVAVQHDNSVLMVKDEFGEWKEGLINIPSWEGECAIVSLLTYANDDAIEKTLMVRAYNAYKECLPEPDKIFPFAQDAGGNLFLFDYRKNDKEPAIVFLDHEEAATEEDLAPEDLARKPLEYWLNKNLHPVCNSFSELLELIYPDDY